MLGGGPYLHPVVGLGRREHAVALVAAQGGTEAADNLAVLLAVDAEGVHVLLAVVVGHLAETLDQVLQGLVEAQLVGPGWGPAGGAGQVPRGVPAGDRSQAGPAEAVAALSRDRGGEEAVAEGAGEVLLHPPEQALLGVRHGWGGGRGGG